MSMAIPMSMCVTIYSIAMRQVCRPGDYRIDGSTSVRECEACPEGATCPTNVYLASLHLEAAHWRLGPNTTGVRRCSIADNENKTSPCIGGANAGVDGAGYCREGHSGPLCERCQQGFSFIKAEGQCMLCPESGDIVGQVFTIGAIIIAIIIAVLALYRLTHAHTLPTMQRASRWFLGVAVALNPTAKLKIVFAFIQIISMLPTIYGNTSRSRCLQA